MGAIDADAHVIETVQTWSYFDDDERRFTPQLRKDQRISALAIKRILEINPRNFYGLN